MTSEYFPWFNANVVILCFGLSNEKSCYSFDGQLTHFGDSNYEHLYGGLTKYNGGLLTLGGGSFGDGFGSSSYGFDGQSYYMDPYIMEDSYFSQLELPSTGFRGNRRTEILKINESKTTSWSVVELEFEFTPGEYIRDHSLVTIESSDINEEYVLLIGGWRDESLMKFERVFDKVFKFNGTWFPFGQLNKPRIYHNSIYWNGAVYVIGGRYNYVDTETKMEIWNINNSPDQFKTKENWPELFAWDYPHLFIVPDSYFPDN